MVEIHCHTHALVLAARGAGEVPRRCCTARCCFFFPALPCYSRTVHFLCMGGTHSVARPMKDAVHPRCEKEPLPPPYAPLQKRRQSQARHPTPLGRQPTIPWPRRRPPSWEATLNREQEINQEEKHRHIQAEQHSKRETVRRRPVGSKIS